MTEHAGGGADDPAREGTFAEGEELDPRGAGNVSPMEHDAGEQGSAEAGQIAAKPDPPELATEETDTP